MHAGLDLVGWFQQQVCPEWTGVSVLAPAGVGSAASTDVAETAMKLEEYVVEGPTAVEGAVLTSSCSVGEPAGEDQPMSNDSSASPSMQKMNNTAGMDRPVRQCHASRHRVPRVSDVMNFAEAVLSIGGWQALLQSAFGSDNISSFSARQSLPDLTYGIFAP